ncbi:dihydrolipoamide dehydrogenase [Haladaptatus litoreus]|uniref:Dihydrolipoamide dehydrogenase n=1 Tax=Haladaptatus litoreus TaxID=553468 RepID=A0A1N6XYA2_9EURY|nr:dihydrolipoyl dehydrogenase [Haladaptatus litoreus]SIR07284.1 dihydrolipoamide dehydrogenase [Haladaptatus litoreus]
MTKFDIVVIGGGTGNKVALAGAERGLDVALIERGPIGGTCVNRGCNPSKTLIHRADVVETVRRASEFGIDAEVTGIDFRNIVREVTETVDGKSERMEQTDRENENITLYREEARFVDDRTLEVGEDGERVSGEKVVVAGGSRPVIPPIEGLDDVDYLTSKDALRLDSQPEHLVIIGGGYIAAELGYFYEMMGTAVTIIGRDDLLLSNEDREVAETFTEIARGRHDVHTGHEATAVSQDGKQVTVTAESEDGDEITVSGDTLLVAAGRRPNTDLLDVEEAGIDTDDRGFVKTNEYLETTAENVWAQGDIAGNYQLKHAADQEAKYVERNALDGEREAIDYSSMGHAIFTSPQVAGTGKTEQELDESNREYVVGNCAYRDTVMGKALNEEHGFVKVLADPEDGEILGCHIIGPEASTLIHEVLLALASGSGTVSDVTDTIHIHPALSKVVLKAFEDVE